MAPARAARKGDRRTVEPRLLAQDGVVQAPQLGTRLETHLVEQDLPGLPERRQGVRLPATAVQREHPPDVEPFAERMLADQVVELADRLFVAPLRQQRVDRGLARP